MLQSMYSYNQNAWVGEWVKFKTLVNSIVGFVEEVDSDGKAIIRSGDNHSYTRYTTELKKIAPEIHEEDRREIIDIALDTWDEEWALRLFNGELTK
jgi:hypothetical protein